MPIIVSDIPKRLGFARRRLEELKALAQAGLLPSDVDGRHQLTQEFFFHLVATIDFTAQVVCERRALGMTPEEVSVAKVCRTLSQTGAAPQLLTAMEGLNIQTRARPLPQDPYSDDGTLFRALNFRNEVVHRNTNPFHFVMSAGPKIAYFYLDPRAPEMGTSKRPVDVDLQEMLDVVQRRCMLVLAAL